MRYYNPRKAMLARKRVRNRLREGTRRSQSNNVHQTDVPTEPQMNVNPVSSETFTSGGEVFGSGIDNLPRNKWYGNAAMIGGGALGGGILSSMLEDDEVQELILKLQRGEPLTYSEEKLLRLLQEE